MTKKEKIESMIKQASEGIDDQDYSDIGEQWVELTHDINWCEMMGPQLTQKEPEDLATDDFVLGPCGKLFVDYIFTLKPDGSIVMDPELIPAKIYVQPGERFEVVVTPLNSVILKKLNP